MFGFGEAAAIGAVLQTLKALNDGLATVKEAGANAGQISSLVSRYSDLDQKIREVEEKGAGVLSLKDSMNLQVAKQQAASFHQGLRDSLLMQQRVARLSTVKSWDGSKSLGPLMKKRWLCSSVNADSVKSW